MSNQTWEVEQMLMCHSHHSHCPVDYSSSEALGWQPCQFDTGSMWSELSSGMLEGVNSPAISQVAVEDGDGIDESTVEESKLSNKETLVEANTPPPLPVVCGVICCSSCFN